MRPIITAIAVILAFVIGTIVGVNVAPSLSEKPIAPINIPSTTNTDTIFLQHEVVKVIHDTLCELKLTVIRDSIYIPITLHHIDTITPEAHFSASLTGYHPHLDSIKITPLNEKRTSPRRIALGVNAGFGFTASGFTPYIGLGINYNIWPL